MSLTHFHIVLITLAWIMTFLFAGWCFFSIEATESGWYMVAGGVAVALALTLIAYQINFIAKIKRLPRN